MRKEEMDDFLRELGNDSFRLVTKYQDRYDARASQVVQVIITQLLFQCLANEEENNPGMVLADYTEAWKMAAEGYNNMKRSERNEAKTKS